MNNINFGFITLLDCSDLCNFEFLTKRETQLIPTAVAHRLNVTRCKISAATLSQANFSTPLRIKKLTKDFLI